MPSPIEPGRYTTLSPRLHNRVALITGAASGIGRAIALAYASEGAKVLVADLQPVSRLDAEQSEGTTVEVVKESGAQADFVSCDVTKEDDVENAVEAAVSRWGRLDIMVNCAGIITDANPPAPIWEAKTSTWSTVMRINGDGVFFGVRAAAAQMVKQDPLPTGDRGWIINLASIFGLVGCAQAGPYNASKHLVMGLTKSAALDLAPYTVHCNAICPGYVRSNMTNPFIEDEQVQAQLMAMHPLRGIGVPEHVSRIAVFLASDDARWVTGQGVVADGGYTTI